MNNKRRLSITLSICDPVSMCPSSRRAIESRDVGRKTRRDEFSRTKVRFIWHFAAPPPWHLSGRVYRISEPTGQVCSTFHNSAEPSALSDNSFLPSHFFLLPQSVFQPHPPPPRPFRNSISLSRPAPFYASALPSLNISLDRGYF